MHKIGRPRREMVSFVRFVRIGMEVAFFAMSISPWLGDESIMMNDN
jgi:hypothetical protein